MKNVYIDFVPNYTYYGLTEEDGIVYTKEGTLNRLVVSNCREVLYKEGYIVVDYRGMYNIRLAVSSVRFLVVN